MLNLDKIRDVLAPKTATQSDYGHAVLNGMQSLPHVYAGTVDAATKTKRRAANRAARRARAVHRRAANR